MSTDKRHLAPAAEAMSYMTFLTYSCSSPIYSSDGSKRENFEIRIFKPLQCFLSFYLKPLSCLQDLQRLLSLDLNNPRGSGDLPHVIIHLSFSFPLISLSLLKSPLTLTLTHTHTHTPHTFISMLSHPGPASAALWVSLHLFLTSGSLHEAVPPSEVFSPSSSG